MYNEMGLRLWLEIEGEGELAPAYQAAIAERFQAAGRQAPLLRHVNTISGQGATWVARWQRDEALWMSRDTALADVRGWAQETALSAAEHWLLMRDVLELAGKPLGYRTELMTIDIKREASNEKKF